MISESIAVIGLGYVGLPVAVAFARQADRVVGFDISAQRIEALERGDDWTGEVSGEEIATSRVHFTSDPAGLAGASLFIVTVPTPVDGQKRPDLEPLRSACAIIGPHLSPGSVVVFESTVFPGATEEICGPALAAASGLTCGTDFTLGYRARSGSIPATGSTGWRASSRSSRARTRPRCGVSPPPIPRSSRRAYSRPRRSGSPRRRR